MTKLRAIKAFVLCVTITNLTRADSGSYTCGLASFQQFDVSVVNGELSKAYFLLLLQYLGGGETVPTNRLQWCLWVSLFRCYYSVFKDLLQWYYSIIIKLLTTQILVLSFMVKSWQTLTFQLQLFERPVTHRASQQLFDTFSKACYQLINWILISRILVLFLPPGLCRKYQHLHIILSVITHYSSSLFTKYSWANLLTTLPALHLQQRLICLRSL